MNAHNFVDLTGRKFGKLTVLRQSALKYGRKLMWECQCECGNITFPRGDGLTTGKTRSCGCDQRAMREAWGARKSAQIRQWMLPKERAA